MLLLELTHRFDFLSIEQIKKTISILIHTDIYFTNIHNNKKYRMKKQSISRIFHFFSIHKEIKKQNLFLKDF